MRALYHDQTNKVYPVPEGVTVLNEVHDVCPTLQRDHQEYRNPGQADVVEADGPVEGVGGAGGAGGVVLVPVDTALSVPLHCLLHRKATSPASLLVAGQVHTFVHAVTRLRGADVGRHQVILLRFVVETGDTDESDISEVIVGRF